MLGKSRAVHRWVAGLLFCGAAVMSACAAARPPLIARSHPEEIVPHASLYVPAELQVAREELDRAKQALNTYEYESAFCLAAQASRDAQVAEARAGTENSRWSAGDVRLSSEAVQAVARRLAVPHLPDGGPPSKE